MIRIFYTRMSVTRRADDAVFYWISQMPPAIRDKINKYRKWQDAQACLFGKVLLHLCLQRFYPYCSLNDLEYTGYNRPYIKQGGPDFNISHSGEYVLCAASNTCRVGIDVEAIRNINFEEYAAWFPDSEWKSIHTATDKQKAFFRTWTQKEALIKANGKGLSIPLKTIHIKDETAQVEDVKWYLRELPLPGQYACQLATDIPPDKIPVTMLYENLQLEKAGAQSD